MLNILHAPKEHCLVQKQQNPVGKERQMTAKIMIYNYTSCYSYSVLFNTFVIFRLKEKLLKYAAFTQHPNNIRDDTEQTQPMLPIKWFLSVKQNVQKGLCRSPSIQQQHQKFHVSQSCIHKKIHGSALVPKGKVRSGSKQTLEVNDCPL